MSEKKIVENSYGKWELTLDAKGKTVRTRLIKLWVNNPPERFKK
jgi:hypothetical protein